MDKRFAEYVERRNTNSVKWDGLKETFGREDILPLWVADSDWPVPAAVMEALKKRVEHGIFGYTVPGEKLDQAVVEWVKRRYKWEIRREWLVYTSGVVPAINIALQAFTGPGGNVVVQPPVYYPFFAAVEKSGAGWWKTSSCRGRRLYRIDFQDLEEKLLAISGRRFQGGGPGRVPCSFAAPITLWAGSGSREELERLAELALKYNLLIISDEIHGDLIYSENNHIPLASLSEEIARRTITMIAPSKTFNLAGLATSVAIIPDREMREAFRRAMEAWS